MTVITCAAFGYMAVSGAVATNHTADNATTAAADNDTPETLQQVTNTLDIVSIDRWGDDSVTFTVRSETVDTLVVTEFTSNEYVTTTYPLTEGKQQITYEFKLGTTNRLFVGADGQGVAIRGSQNAFREALSDATEYMIPHAATGGGVGTIVAVVGWYFRKSRKMKSRFVDYVTKQKVEVPDPEDVEKDEPDEEGEDGWLPTIKAELAKTRTRLILLAVAVLGVQQYYNITPDDVPIWLYVMLFSAVGVGAAAYIVWPKINAWLGLFEIPRDLIADLGNYDHYHDADIQDGLEPVESVNKKLPVTLWKAHPKLVDQVDIRGEKRSYSISSGSLHVVRAFNPKTLEAEAAAITEVPEYELATLAEAVEEHRKRSNLFRRFGEKVHRSITTVLEKVESAHHMRLNQKEREAQAFNAEGVENDLHRMFPELEELKEEGRPVTEEYQQLNYSDETNYDPEEDSSVDEAGGDE